MVSDVRENIYHERAGSFLVDLTALHALYLGLAALRAVYGLLRGVRSVAYY